MCVSLVGSSRLALRACNLIVAHAFQLLAERVQQAKPHSSELHRELCVCLSLFLYVVCLSVFCFMFVRSDVCLSVLSTEVPYTHVCVSYIRPFFAACLSITLRCCPSVCPPQMSPVPVLHGEEGEGLLPKTALEAEQAGPAFPTNFLPMGTIPLIATQCFTYKDTLKRVTEVANKVYYEFLESEEGQNFNGQVCFVCMFVGMCCMYVRMYVCMGHSCGLGLCPLDPWVRVPPLKDEH